jgi:hypothetical protein
LDKIGNYIKVGVFSVKIPREQAEILINLVKRMFGTTCSVTIIQYDIEYLIVSE